MTKSIAITLTIKTKAAFLIKIAAVLKTEHKIISTIIVSTKTTTTTMFITIISVILTATTTTITITTATIIIIVTNWFDPRQVPISVGYKIPINSICSNRKYWATKSD